MTNHRVEGVDGARRSRLPAKQMTPLEKTEFLQRLLDEETDAKTTCATMGLNPASWAKTAESDHQFRDRAAAILKRTHVLAKPPQAMGNFEPKQAVKNTLAFKRTMINELHQAGIAGMLGVFVRKIDLDTDKGQAKFLRLLDIVSKMLPNESFTDLHTTDHTEAAKLAIADLSAEELRAKIAMEEQRTLSQLDALESNQRIIEVKAKDVESNGV